MMCMMWRLVKALSRRRQRRLLAREEVDEMIEVAAERGLPDLPAELRNRAQRRWNSVDESHKLRAELGKFLRLHAPPICWEPEPEDKP
jgi:hypothetical protein